MVVNLGFMIFTLTLWTAVGFLGQAGGLMIYARNLYFIHRDRLGAGAGDDQAPGGG